ncbi:sensor domain-containing protein [Maledivibacter halophilus]|uniref:PAS domain S-box-containing protein/diguanylate cyclase (GGDEF) domain-containing protein n=1 Tax=Maledivibacter halophilus TaxID=36842 RepID=A0A1T5L447_9FIRM|nr:EAL domain-containing protein [Maledivibacter halophilus]SKC70807.1 PAS domain S-box-containing protein/diguanylate cyclase (GGDEF) domain-containing protein [Maledivibacter halophilus]
MKIRKDIINFLLSENALEGFLIIKEDKIVDCNHRFVNMLGHLTKDDLIGEKFYDLAWKIQNGESCAIEIFKRMAANTFNYGRSKFEYKFKTISGEMLWTEIIFIEEELQGERIINGIIKDITLWKEFESFINEGENKYASIFNNPHTPMLIIDSKNGDIKDVNWVACDYHGYLKEKMLKMNIKDINNLTEKEIYDEMKLAKMEDRKFFRFKHKLANGRVKDVEVYSGPIVISNEIFLLFIIHDVQEKKEIEERYEIKNTYFKYLFEYSPEAIALLDNEFRIMNVNKSFEEIFMYSIDEIRYKNITNVICDEEAYDESTYFKDCIKKGEFVRKETKRKRRDGKLVEVAFLGFPIIKDKKQIGVNCIYSDVSKIKEEEKNKRLFSEIFKNNTVGVVITDINGNIEWINDTFTKITGYTSLEVVGKNPNILKSGKHDNNYYSNMWNSILTDGKWQGEIYNKRKNGEIYQEWLNIIAVKDDNGNIEHFIAMLNDITDEKQKEKKIEILTNRDNLTQLYNREYFINKLNYEILKREKNEEYNKGLAIFFLDIDDFKEINDTLGHLIGDEILKKYAGRLSECISENDLIARFGGDEFIILFPTIKNSYQIMDIAERILEVLKTSYIVNGCELNMMTSIGISIYPHDGTDSTTLVRNADIAMYKSKEVKGNKFTIFEPIFDKKIQENFEIKNNLRHAINKKELFLNYQPIYSSLTEKIIGVEALLRWNYEGNKLIPPSKFIPIAEKSGEINAIGEWVLTNACKQNSIWQSSGHKPIFMSVNVSILQLEHPNFFEIVRRILRETGMKARYLQLEITETILTKNTVQVIEIVKQLNKLGVRLAIDDFGTGYSSLGQLSKFNVDKIKIDRMFIDGITNNYNKKKIVKAIISMAKSLNIGVIAEGVETIEQLGFLKQNRCNMIQGYLFSKPISAKEIERKLSKSYDWYPFKKYN